MTSTAVSTSPTTLSLSLADYPGINRFALDLVGGSARASRYCRRAAMESLRPPGAARGRQTLVDALIRSNAAWGNDVEENLRRWERGETVTIIAGQQVGFAGGPLYTLAKIASLVKLERGLAKRGIDATLFFWLATEDHD
ncbi:MAG TPA: bacillithiol biosynthesis BshC, partial [Thermoanaerobaculia bacterium]